MRSAGFIARRRFLISPVPFPEDFAAQRSERRVVGFEFLPGVDVIVRGIVLPVVAEPALHPFSPIFRRIAGGIKPLPPPQPHGPAKGLVEPLIKGRIDYIQSHLVDGVGEFVDQDVLGGIMIARKSQQIFLPATHRWSVRARPQAPGPAVPIILRRQLGVFRQVGGVFIMGHHREADPIFGERLNPLYYLGAITYFLLWVVIGTGLYLYAFFETGVAVAYGSVEALTHGQWFAGGILRSFHRYASDGLVITMLLHLVRHFTFDHHRGFRWFSWVSGVVLLWLTFASGVNGYMLPWDRLAQFVVTATTEWFDALPVIGGSMTRNFITNAGQRSIGVGYPGNFNIAWSAESMNLQLVWRGAFIDAARHWNSRGGGAQPPLGYDVFQPVGNLAPPLAVLAKPDAPWPSYDKEQRFTGFEWKGYTLDAKRAPIFRYTWQGAEIEETFTTIVVYPGWRAEVDAAGDYMCVHVQGQTHIMRTTMKELEAQLDPNIFQRVHRSTIVNLQRVEKVSSHINGEFHLTLTGGSSLKMSRSYKDKVKHFF